MHVPIYIELFKKNGYDETSVNEICQCCDLTKGTFYYHFNSKNEIISNYWEYIFSSVTSILPQLIAISDAKQKLWKISEYISDQISSLTPSLIRELLILAGQNKLRNFAPTNSTEVEKDWSNNSGKYELKEELRQLFDVIVILQRSSYLSCLL